MLVSLQQMAGATLPGTSSGGPQEGASEEESDKEVIQKTDLLNEILLALKTQEHERMHDEVSLIYLAYILVWKAQD